MTVALTLGIMLGFAPEAQAQDPCDPNAVYCSGGGTSGYPDQLPPQIGVTPASGTALTRAKILAVVTFCDDYYGTDISSIRLWLNGASIDPTAGIGSQSICGPAAQSGNDAMWSDSLALSPGDNTFRVVACDMLGDPNNPTNTSPHGGTHCSDVTTLWNFDQYANAAKIVKVRAERSTRDVPRSDSSTAVFIVRNESERPTATTFPVSVACDTLVVKQCQLSASSVVLSPGQEQSVTVKFKTTSVFGAVGNIVVTAQHPEGGSGSATTEITTVEARPVGVSLVGLPGVVESGLCTSYSLPGASVECGDLLLGHAMPAARTLNKSRAPVVTYSSRHAHPMPIVAADVTLGSATAPDSVIATLYVGNVARATGKWLGAGWTAGVTRRIALSYDALNDSTGAYADSLRVVAWTAGASSSLPTARGRLIVVNRSASPFGAGWWLAGLERLVTLANNERLWVSGDGSARIYSPTGQANQWVAPRVDQPDTLSFDSATGYYFRLIPGGARVQFSSTGRQLATVPRVGPSTRFAYRNDSLVWITVPSPQSGSDSVFAHYEVRYAPIDTITVALVRQQGTVRSERAARLIKSGGKLVTIRDPDAIGVSFEYSDPGSPRRVSARIDRGGTRTTFGYGWAGMVTEGRTVVGASQTVVYGITAAETRGSSASTTAAPIDSVYTLLDGPRTDKVDVTRIWPNHAGAPAVAVDALGNEIKVVYGDTLWPGLATRVRRWNGFATTASYDASRGLMVASIAINPLGDGRSATTTYVYDPVFPAPTRITQPTRDYVEMGYDASGNRIWQQDGRGAPARVSFFYNARGQVDSIRTPLAPRAERFTYDSLGNLRQSTTPIGFQTKSFADAWGRDTLALSPLDSAQTLWRQDRTIFNPLMDRADSTQSVGPATSGPQGARPAETAMVRTFYNANGQTDSVLRKSVPDLANIGWVKTAFVYDKLGRKVKELAPVTTGQAAQYDSTVYDAAGNATSVRTRRGDWISMNYDELNRLTTRSVPARSYPSESDFFSFPGPSPSTGLTIPGETATFDYDGGGNILTARNSNSWISRSYTPSGLMTLDRQRIADATGGFTSHVYDVRYAYDLGGRRTVLYIPQQLGNGGIGYTYDTLTAALASIDDQDQQVTRFVYDLENRLDSLDAPGFYEKHYYDGDGRLTRRVEKAPGAIVPLLHDDVCTTTRLAVC